jgi:hypothetical protein
MRIAAAHSAGQAVAVAEALIERDEIVALLFNVSDIAATLARIDRRLAEDDGEEEEDDQG